MIPQDLDYQINKCISDNEVPLMVNTTMGTTVFGSIDPINEIADVCKKHNVWMHLDAALGGSAMFAPSKKDFIKGINKVDSITMDFHKSLVCPLQTSIFMCKHPGVMFNANSMKAK